MAPQLVWPNVRPAATGSTPWNALVFNTLYFQLLGFSGGAAVNRCVCCCSQDSRSRGKLARAGDWLTLTADWQWELGCPALLMLPWYVRLNGSFPACCAPFCRLPGFPGGSPLPGRHRLWGPGAVKRRLGVLAPLAPCAAPGLHLKVPFHLQRCHCYQLLLSPSHVAIINPPRWATAAGRFHR